MIKLLVKYYDILYNKKQKNIFLLHKIKFKTNKKNTSSVSVTSHIATHIALKWPKIFMCNIYTKKKSYVYNQKQFKNIRCKIFHCSSIYVVRKNSYTTCNALNNTPITKINYSLLSPSKQKSFFLSVCDKQKFVSEKNTSKDRYGFKKVYINFVYFFFG